MRVSSATPWELVCGGVCARVIMPAAAAAGIIKPPLCRCGCAAVAPNSSWVPCRVQSTATASLSIRCVAPSPAHHSQRSAAAVPHCCPLSLAMQCLEVSPTNGSGIKSAYVKLSDYFCLLGNRSMVQVSTCVRGVMPCAHSAANSGENAHTARFGQLEYD